MRGHFISATGSPGAGRGPPGTQARLVEPRLCTPGGRGRSQGRVPLPLLRVMPGARSPTGQPGSRVTSDSSMGGGVGRAAVGSESAFLSAELTPSSSSSLEGVSPLQEPGPNPLPFPGKAFNARNGLQVTAGRGQMALR